MIFKRRDKRPLWKIVVDFLYPKGGWSRAFQYVKLRLRRLPDPPHKISRGIWAGVFTAFTPFYGLHFVVAALLARVMQGNMLAALLATFFGNPLTFLPIGLASLKTGHFLLGTEFDADVQGTFLDKFIVAGQELTDNFWAMFTAKEAHWQGLELFYDEVFFPYLVGGLIPGIFAASICYYLALPVISAYKKRRTKKIAAKLASLRKKRELQADADKNAD